MEINSSFVTGLAAGVCLGFTLFSLRKSFSRVSIPTATKSTKKEGQKFRPKDDREYKLVLIVRNDLKMGKGKVAAQCAHAAVGVYAKASKDDEAALRAWEYTGQAKIALKVESEKELMDVYENAKKAGLITSLIRDAGRTQIAPNSKTVLGVGPASVDDIDKVTGHLKLY